MDEDDGIVLHQLGRFTLKAENRTVKLAQLRELLSWRQREPRGDGPLGPTRRLGAWGGGGGGVLFVVHMVRHFGWGLGLEVETHVSAGTVPCGTVVCGLWTQAFEGH